MSSAHTLGDLRRRVEAAEARLRRVVDAAAAATGTVAVAVAVPPPPPPPPPSAALPLPARVFTQRGANCRQVALGNILRRAQEPTLRDLQPHYAAFLRDHFPREAVVVGASSSGSGQEGVEWTLRGAAHTCLMTVVLEAEWDGVAWLATPQELPALARFLGGVGTVVDHVLRDRASPGLVYFSDAHCMSVLQAPDGTWWNVPQSSMSKVGTPATQLRSCLHNHSGFVLCWSRSYTRQVLVPALLRTYEQLPLLAARTARRLLPATHECLRAQPWHTYACQDAVATPAPRRSPQLLRAVAEAARVWLTAAARV